MSSSQSPLYFNDRDLGNDLVGELKGSVLFAQVSVLPSRSSPIAGDVQPRLTGLRDILVMFKPISAIDAAEGIQLSVGDFTLAMAPPEQLPPIAERDSDAEYGRIVYGENFWSAILPWQQVMAGMDLVFRAGALSGTFADADVGAPGEMLVNTIDIGMLTPNQRVFIDDFTDELQRQYYQTIPCSRLIVNQYEPVHCEVIEMADGTHYTDHSAEKGEVHGGDLRQRIGKELISLGINNAAVGVHSSPGSGEDGLNRHWVVAQLTAHSSVGNYSNGRVVHGLSGGGSIVTLYGCDGNEFSHELGHNFGINHYPGGFDGSIHRAAFSPNSTWGWDSDRNVFLPNFEKAITGVPTCQSGRCEQPFHGHSFGKDTMAEGYPLYPDTNRYTMLTPYSLKIAQGFIEGKAVFSKTSSTGYMKWDEGRKSMVEWGELYRAAPEEAGQGGLMPLLRSFQRVEVDIFDGHWATEIFLPIPETANRGKGVRIIHQATYETTLHLNGTTLQLNKGDVLNFVSDGRAWEPYEDFPEHVAGRPQQIGVPATTLVGFYDPDLQRAGIAYPALHCAYGVIHPAASAAEVDAARCYAWISNARNERLYFVLHGTRLNTNELNRFHFNVPQSFQATHVRVICHGTQNVYGVIAPPKGTARVTFTGRDAD
ncbi:M66 family metalloprotease [Pseudomonas sp. NyZ201]|uniref:M66 family metalloprotease n=1 Tax=Pseudomonas sp. NyZ201 TaxID=3409857 RepID=UPI003CF0C845